MWARSSRNIKETKYKYCKNLLWYWNNINEHNLNIPEAITSNTINDDVDRGVNHQEQMTNWDQAHQDQGRTKSISTSLHFGSQGAFENTEANSEKKK